MLGDAGSDMGGLPHNMSELHKHVNMQSATLPRDEHGFPSSRLGDTSGKEATTTSSTTSTTCTESVTTATTPSTTVTSASSTVTNVDASSSSLRASPPQAESESVKHAPTSPASSSGPTIITTVVSGTITNTSTTPTSGVNTANQFSPRAHVPGPRLSMHTVPLPPVPPPGGPNQQPPQPSPPSAQQQQVRGPASEVIYQGPREQLSPGQATSPGSQQQQNRPARPGSSGSPGSGVTPTGMSPVLAGMRSPNCRTPPHSQAQPQGFQSPSPGASSASSPGSIPSGDMVRLGHMSPPRMGYLGDHRMPHMGENRFVFPRAARPLYAGPVAMMSSRFGHISDYRHRFPGDSRYGPGPGEPRFRPEQFVGMADYRYIPSERLNHGMQYPHGSDHRFPHMGENRYPHPGARFPYDTRFTHGGEPGFHMGENRFPQGNRIGPPQVMPPPPPLSHTNTLSTINPTNTVSDSASTTGSPRPTTLHGEMSPGAVRGQGHMPSQLSGSRSPQGQLRRPDSLSLALDRFEGTSSMPTVYISHHINVARFSLLFSINIYASCDLFINLDIIIYN